MTTRRKVWTLTAIFLIGALTGALIWHRLACHQSVFAQNCNCISGASSNIFVDSSGSPFGAPFPFGVNPGGLTFTSFTFNTALTDAIEYIFQAQDAGTITTLGYHQSTSFGGSPGAQTISLQGVNATVAPARADGVIKGGGTPASASFTPTNTGHAWIPIALNNSYTCTRGELLAIVITGGAALSGANFFSVSAAAELHGAGSGSVAFPYAVTVDAGTGSALAQVALFGYNTASTAYGKPIANATSVTYSSDTVPDERALRFRVGDVSTSRGSYYNLVGVRVWGAAATAAKTIKFTLYDGTTALQSYTYDSDLKTTSNANRLVEIRFTENPLSVLTFNGVYRLGIAPQETSSGWGLQEFTVSSTGNLSAFPGGVDWFISTRTDAGAWTDDNTRRPVMELLVRGCCF